METEQSFIGLPSSVWRGEPFRIFFPLGVVLAWVGIGHWLLYAIGVTSSYSCMFHGVVQMQAFMMAFAIGFLLTAVPRRTGTPPASAIEIVALATALITTTAAAVAEQWMIAEGAYGALFVLLLQFAVRRFVGREAGRRPPAAFVLIPIGVLQGIGGAVLIAMSTASDAPAWQLGFGRLLVEQGVFLCFAVGVGSLVLPLLAGAAPPPDLGSSPRETWRALLYGSAGVVIFASLVLEQAGWLRAAPLLRAAVVACGLLAGGGAWRAPGKPGLHRRLVWLSVWLMPFGLVASALSPDYRVPALHILFIGGFGLMAFGVATHVALSHLGLEQLALGRPRAVIVLGAGFLLAMAGRVAADASNTYFAHLGWAAGCWLVGSLAWLAFFAPKFWRRSA
ncbi:MAG: NnrS family protein [Deltaproteobacteria bacterium]|nr:NnrS family protein [Deltaproteobacteria bacterium]MBI3386989.1 NnrS family protein [Deltaproteobacteria bacterium]